MYCFSLVIYIIGYKYINILIITNLKNIGPDIIKTIHWSIR